MIFGCRTWRAIVAVSVAVATPQLTAGTVNLHGIADGDSIYIEEFADGFYRMDLYDPPPRQTQQRFHLISNPSVTVGNLNYDGFPNDANLRLGSIAYDESSLNDGNGTATITAVLLGVAYDPADPTYYNYYRWTDNKTVVDTFSGTVTVNSGQVTAIHLTSNVHLVVNIVGTIISAPGTFTITGDRFDGFMEFVYAGQYSFIWDFAGTLTTLSEPPSDADFDDDGDVDGRDFLRWQRGQSPNGLTLQDLQAWQTAYETPVFLAEYQIPEPNALLFLSLAGLLTGCNLRLRNL